MSTKRKKAYLALTLTAVIWGMAFPIIKPAFAYISPMQYLYLRFLVAGLASLPIFIYFYIKLRPKTSYLLKSLLIELIGTPFPLLLLYEGLDRTSALEASLIGSTGPIFTVLGGIWFLRERETKKEWQGLALSLAGSLILVAEPLLFGRTDTPSGAAGNLLIMTYNIVYTCYLIMAKKFYKTKPPLYLGALTYLATAVIYTPILMQSAGVPALLSAFSNSVVRTAVLYMAIPGTVFCFMLYLYGLSKIEASETNSFTYLNGIVAIPAAYFILGEKPSLVTLAAIAVIAAGVYRAEVKKR